MPDAELAREKEDAGEKRGNSQTSESVSKVILDSVDARVLRHAKCDRCLPSEESGIADSSAAVLLFEELDPVLDLLEIILFPK